MEMEMIDEENYTCQLKKSVFIAFVLFICLLRRGEKAQGNGHIMMLPRRAGACPNQSLRISVLNKTCSFLRQETGDAFYEEVSLPLPQYVAVLTVHEVVTKIARTKTIPLDPYTDELPKWVRHALILFKFFFNLNFLHDTR